MKNPNKQSQAAHGEFTASDRKLAKLKHKQYKKNQPEAYKEEKQRMLKKLVDLVVNTKYPTFDGKLTLLV